MPILNKQNEEEIKRYEKYISSYDGSSLMQSLNWARSKFGWIQEAVYLEENGEISLQGSLYSSPL